jgi:hypothetical protein
MAKYSDINISLDGWDKIVEAVEEHEGDNPACHLGKYWKDRMSPQMKKALESSDKLPYGFVGDGWPQRSNQDYAIENDKYGLRHAYHKDDWNCRDVGDAIYQGNIITDYLKDPGRTIFDIGAGYGRLIPSLFKLFANLYFWGIDYSPIGLLTSWQFVKQMTKDCSIFDWQNYIVRQKGTIQSFNWFCSCPAWKIEDIQVRGEFFVSIHSFQEMLPETIWFYIDWMKKIANEGALFYSVNLDTVAESPSGVTWLDMIPDEWELIFDRPYPINRDGSFNERMWRIR